jgi:hypothetical protein
MHVEWVGQSSFRLTGSAATVFIAPSGHMSGLAILRRADRLRRRRGVGGRWPGLSAPYHDLLALAPARDAPACARGAPALAHRDADQCPVAKPLECASPEPPLAVPAPPSAGALEDRPSLEGSRGRLVARSGVAQQLERAPLAAVGRITSVSGRAARRHILVLPPSARDTRGRTAATEHVGLQRSGITDPVRSGIMCASLSSPEALAADG